jgi:hypothetical protein
MDQVHEKIKHLHLVERRITVLAGSRRPREGKNARADNGPDAQRRQRPWSKSLLEPVGRVLGVRNQLVNGLLGKKLAGQKRLLERLMP